MKRLTHTLAALVCSVALLQNAPAYAQPATQGEWGALLTWGEQTIHLAVLKNKKVLGYSKSTPYIIDPAAPQSVTEFNPPSAPPHLDTLFCSGHTQLSDGRVVFFGGGNSYDCAHAHTVIFVPDVLPADPWVIVSQEMPPAGEENVCGDPAQPKPLGRRWYPTAVTLPSGRALCISGGKNEIQTPGNVPLVFVPNAGPSSTYVELFDAEQQLPWYPFMFLLTSGKVFYAGSHYFNAGLPGSPIQVVTQTLDTSLQTWTIVDDSEIKGGSAVMYKPDWILKAGGGLNRVQGPPGQNNSITDEVMRIDMSETPTEWVFVAEMKKKRVHFYLIVLPDGKVLAVGGGEGADGLPGGSAYDNPVLTPELYDPVLDEWNNMADMGERRQYHSAAVLLHDGRILIAGGQHPPGQVSQETARIYSPPYLFDKDGAPATALRPAITSAPATIEYGKSFTIQSPQAGDVVKVVLMGLGSATHSFDHNQRRVELSFVLTVDPDLLKVSPPAHWNIAPPAFYMLYILTDGDRAGILFPSDAEMVQLVMPANE